MLDIGDRQSELTIFEKNVPIISRILFRGSESPPGTTEIPLEMRGKFAHGSLAGAKLYISGEVISDELAASLAKMLASEGKWERLESQTTSAAICGLRKVTEKGVEPEFCIRIKQPDKNNTSPASLDLKKWAIRAGALLAAALLFPCIEALVLKPHLAKQVAAFKVETARLTVIDRELDFLRYLKSSQPPYLEALYVLSKSVPAGTRFDSLSLNSHGEISLRGIFNDGQQVADFRSKLISSGFFANVSIDEQSPTPDRQRVNVRISAQEKPPAQLLSLSVGPSADEIATNGKPATAGTPTVRKEAK